MRRESRRNNVNNNNFKKMLYLSVSVLGVTILAFVVTFVIYSTSLNNEAKQSRLNTASITDLMPNNIESSNSEIASSSIGKSVEESENVLNSNVTEVTKNITNSTETDSNTNNTDTNENTVETNTETQEPEEEKIEDPTFIKPVEGEILKEYAKETLVYSETLEEWITHLGIDIKAEKATVVKAASDGKIKSIKNDPRYGLTIIMEHTNGFTTVYSNLLSTEFVVIGEAVEKGQSIGTVGNTSTFESADDYHLHFEILKDNVQLDPSLYI